MFPRGGIPIFEIMVLLGRQAGARKLARTGSDLPAMLWRRGTVKAASNCVLAAPGFAMAC
ncbi:MAG: hypothetical protein E6G35_15500 [Actinobacteria bacterium]|nr:MAG: hypothetical protein E6G35_15500 [Actinomycetota bacterium]